MKQLFLLLTLINTSLFAVSQNVELIKITENTYIHVSVSEIPPFGMVSSNGLVFVNKNEAFIFDTPVTENQTKNLVTMLRDKMGLNVVGFVPNHWHGDCMGGLEYIKSQGIKSYANKMTIDIARANGLPLPDIAFSDSLILNLGGEKIELYYFGGAHSKDNIVVWIPSEKVLFPGCMVKSLDSKTPGNLSDGDIQAYPLTLKRLKEKFKSAKFVVPGHGHHGGMDLIDHTLRLL